eukprot:COSAG01_NODE_58045_length_308_cov_1.229665_1_plen_43_part_10
MGASATLTPDTKSNGADMLLATSIKVFMQQTAPFDDGPPTRSC